MEEKPSWSPDGRWIYFSLNKGIARVPADGSKAPEILANLGFEAFASPDGKRVYFVRTYETSLVMMMDAVGGPERPVPGLPPFKGDRWGVVPTGIYYLDQSGSPTPTRVMLYRFEDQRIVELMSFQLGRDESTNGISLRPDLAAFAFVHIDPEEDVWMIRNFR